MTLEEALRALWRRKWIVVLTVLVVTFATYLISSWLPAVYSSRATLYVKDTSTAANDFEAIQSAQVLAKTYAELIQSENVADDVASQTPGDETGGELLDRVSFEPLPDTQLVVITAEDNTAAGAAELADTYASVFTDYSSADALGQEIEGEVTIADPAATPSSPVRPRPSLYAAVGGFSVCSSEQGSPYCATVWTPVSEPQRSSAPRLACPSSRECPRWRATSARSSRSTRRASSRPCGCSTRTCASCPGGSTRSRY